MTFHRRPAPSIMAAAAANLPAVRWWAPTKLSSVPASSGLSLSVETRNSACGRSNSSSRFVLASGFSLALFICSCKCFRHLSNGDASSTTFRRRAKARISRCASGSPLLDSSTKESLASSLTPFLSLSRNGGCSGNCRTVRKNFRGTGAGANSPMTRRICFAESAAIFQLN